MLRLCALCHFYFFLIRMNWLLLIFVLHAFIFAEVISAPIDDIQITTTPKVSEVTTPTNTSIVTPAAVSKVNWQDVKIAVTTVIAVLTFIFGLVEKHFGCVQKLICGSKLLVLRYSMRYNIIH